MDSIIKTGETLFLLFQVVLSLFFLLPFFLLVQHSFRKKRELYFTKFPIKHEKDFDFAAIVTAHQDVRFILPLIDSFVKQTYKNFIVYIIADDCDISSIQVQNERVKIIKPSEALNAKIKSIEYAVDRFERSHDVIVVFDADNLVHPDYLKNLNEYFRRGFRAVQTHMLSKNTDSVFAKLDSMGHVYNNFVERKARMELGLSSSILGLGVAIESALYMQVIYKDNLGGFDKKLQSVIVQSVSQLAFAEEALVFDEKVEDGNTFEKQRTRWIYTYFKYFQDNLAIFLKGIRRLNFNLLFFGFSVLRPPLFITLGSAITFMIIDLFIFPAIAQLWMVILVLFIITFVIIVLTQSRQKGLGVALFYLPVLVLKQIRSLLRIKQAKKSFLKTEHSKIVYIDEILKNERV